jgi:hypothetical protein
MGRFGEIGAVIEAAWGMRSAEAADGEFPDERRRAPECERRVPYAVTVRRRRRA